MNKIINKGTKAGGKNTTVLGKTFELITCNKKYLLEQGYIENIIIEKKKSKNNTFLYKKFNDKTIVYVSQYEFKNYIKFKYNINVFRNPDEAYIIEFEKGETFIKILEKKEQNVSGSIETKLWSGPSLKREYEIIFGSAFKIFYSFSINDFLKKKIMSTCDKKYTILNIILKENNINIFFGNDTNYFLMLNNWINN